MRRALSPEAILFALCLGAYAYFYQAGGWNQNSRLDLTRALVERRTTVIDAYVKNTGDNARKDGRYYCDKAPGVSLLAVPVWGVTWLVAGRPAVASPALITAGSYLSTLLAVGLPSAAAAVLLYLLARALAASRGVAATLALAYALGTLAWPHATLFYGHGLVAALQLGAFALLVQIRRGAAPTAARLVAIGALVGLSINVEYSAALGGLVLAAYALVAVRPLPRIGWALAGGAVPIVVLLVYHAAAFGGPFTLPYSFSTQKHRHMGWFMGLGRPDLHVLRVILVSEYRGLFYSAPWLWLAVPGVPLLIADRETRAEGVACAAGILVNLWLNASLVDWHGGWTLGPRYLVPSLPFWAVGALGVARFVAKRGPALRRGVYAASGALAVLSFVYMLAGTAVKPEVPVVEQHTWSRYVWPRFCAGELAVSTQSFDMIGAPDGAPPKAWNLGHQLGLHGLGSLAPLALWLAGGGALLGLALRRATNDPEA
jgi:hypothetical protein